MTTTRPYQQAMENEYVVERIKQFAGIRYDPVVVEAFVRAWEKGNLAPIPVRPALEEPELPELAEAL
jgi:response regulator RpfG family c-di-GMP phosphodiesterase